MVLMKGDFSTALILHIQKQQSPDRYAKAKAHHVRSAHGYALVERLAKQKSTKLSHILNELVLILSFPLASASLTFA